MEDLSMHFKIYSRFFFSKLNQDEKNAYETILNAWLNLEKRVSVKKFNRNINFQKVFESIINDTPELFYVVFNSLSAAYGLGFASISVEFSMPNDEIERTKSKIFAKVQEFKNSVKTKDIEKEIHDYLATNVKYASNTMLPTAHNICGPFLEGSAVCEGYARAFKLMCDEMGIPCIMVTGVATDENITGNHAWNIVRKGKNNYHVDMTWNSSVYKSSDFPLYYNVSDAFIEKDHTWNKVLFPRCSALGEYEREIIEVNGKKAFCDAIEKMALNKKQSFILRFNKQLNLTTNMTTQIENVLKERNITSVSSISFSYLTKDCVRVQFCYGKLYGK